MFSILVSELTPELLKKAEYWKFIGESRCNVMWANTRHRSQLCLADDATGALPLREYGSDDDMYTCNVRCFPVTLSPDGTEVRLECPQMPDEECVGPLSEDAIFADYDADDHGWNFYNVGYRRIFCTAAPTPEHYPRRTCDGVWVWSTRR